MSIMCYVIVLSLLLVCSIDSWIFPATRRCWGGAGTRGRSASDSSTETRPRCEVGSLLAVEKGDVDLSNDLFKLWEEEEIELQKAEVLDRINEMQDADPTGAIPEYMLKMLDGFDEFKTKDDAVAEAKLPILAIIGRPNTGKSTIVNKLTNSYKVRVGLLLSMHAHFLLLRLVRLYNRRTERLCTTSQVSLGIAPTAQLPGATTTSKWWTPEGSCSTTPKTSSRTVSHSKH